jgi:hypothetical protein
MKAYLARGALILQGRTKVIWQSADLCISSRGEWTSIWHRGGQEVQECYDFSTAAVVHILANNYRSMYNIIIIHANCLLTWFWSFLLGMVWSGSDWNDPVSDINVIYKIQKNCSYCTSFTFKQFISRTAVTIYNGSILYVHDCVKSINMQCPIH